MQQQQKQSDWYMSPEYAAVLPALTDLFQRAATAGKQNAEVEGKLGFLNERGQFDSGVPQQTYNELLKLLEGNPNWDRVTDWVDSQDYFFPESVRGTQTLDNDPFFQRKVTMQHLDIKCPDRTLGIRVSWKDEIPVGPPTALPQWVRIKTRKSFLHKNFSFDLTYVWSGPTDTKAQAEQPRYEVEIECKNLNDPKGPEYLALSLLMKLHDLLGRKTACRFELVK